MYHGIALIFWFMEGLSEVSIYFTRDFFFFYPRLRTCSLVLERVKGRERVRERNITAIGCLSQASWVGTESATQHVPWAGIEPGTLWFTGPVLQPSVQGLFDKRLYGWICFENHSNIEDTKGDLENECVIMKGCFDSVLISHMLNPNLFLFKSLHFWYMVHWISLMCYVQFFKDLNLPSQSHFVCITVGTECTFRWWNILLRVTLSIIKCTWELKLFGRSGLPNIGWYLESKQEVSYSRECDFIDFASCMP